MPEYYKTQKGYCYKKTQKGGKCRITKAEYEKAMKGGGIFRKKNTLKITYKELQKRENHLYNKSASLIIDLMESCDNNKEQIKKCITNKKKLLVEKTDIENKDTSDEINILDVCLEILYIPKYYYLQKYEES